MDGHSRPETNHSRSPSPTAKELSDKLILEVEKFRAQVSTPKGKIPDFVNAEKNNFGDEFDFEHFKQMHEGNIEMRHFFDSDDNFFHVTCHLDLQLKQKIRRGEFVELER